MNCKKVEKYLCQCPGGITDPYWKQLVDEHIRSCRRCERLFAVIREVHRELTFTPEISPLPQKVIENIVGVAVRRRHYNINKKARLKLWNGASMSKLSVAGAMAAMVVVGFFISLFFLLNDSSHHGKTVAAAVIRGQQVETIFRDTTLFFMESCIVRLQRHSCCAVLQADPTVVRIVLHYGKLLVAARKDAYDTLEVCTGTIHTLATGTHFEVNFSGGLFGVSVLEGTVLVVGPTGITSAVRPLEQCTFNEPENAFHLDSFSVGKQKQLINDFAGMTAACIRFGLAGNHPEKTASMVRRHDSPALSRRNPAIAPDSGALRKYQIAKNMMAKRNFALAAHVLEDFLTKPSSNADSAWFDLGYCYTIMGRYGDAVFAYHRAATEGVDEPLLETALHRCNKILFLKLSHYDEARQGIKEYLSTYPTGRWREEEWYYRVKVAIALGNALEAKESIHGYLAEFPRTCKNHELTAAVEKLQHRER